MTKLGYNDEEIKETNNNKFNNNNKYNNNNNKKKRRDRQISVDIIYTADSKPSTAFGSVWRVRLARLNRQTTAARNRA